LEISIGAAAVAAACDATSSTNSSADSWYKASSSCSCEVKRHKVGINQALQGSGSASYAVIQQLVWEFGVI
jgi:hypothetical protein